MASSSPILQTENKQKNCEELIKSFNKAERFTGKLDFLGSLTYQVFPDISLMDMETKYFAKVIPKVYEMIIEVLVKIVDLLQALGCTDDDESILLTIQSNLKGVITCIEYLESCTLHVCQTAPSLSIKQIHSLHPAVLKTIIATFTHCKESESIYSDFFQHFSEELSILFKKTFQLQKVLMELIEKVNLDYDSDSEEVKDMTDVCHHLLEICILICNVDTGLLVNTWKVLNRLVTKHKAAIENDLDVEKIVNHLCDSIKSKLTQCVTMATINDGQDPGQFANTAESKSLSRMLKVVRFLIGHLIHIVKEYSEYLSGCESSILSLLISLHSILPPSLSAPQIVASIQQEMSSLILVVIQPLLKILVTNKAFADLVTRKARANGTDFDGFGMARVLVDIAGILPEQPDDVFTLWMKPMDYPEEEPCLSLLQKTIECLKTCAVELSLPVYVDGIMCMGKPLRKVGFYEHACSHLCALIASSPSSCFSQIERCLVEYLIGEDLFSVILAMDLWTFLGRWESAELCSSHAHFLIGLMNSLPKGSTSQCHVSRLVRRLTRLMAKDHQEQLLSSFPPSKAENILTWSILPFGDLTDDIRSKVCRTAVPVCIKRCHDCLSSKPSKLHENIHYIGCLKAIYSLEHAHRLVPPVHHSAVVDLVNNVWTKFNKQAIKMSEDVWLDVIELSGLLLPFIQPQDYARILRCLRNLSNQCNSVSIKVAIADFLGKCGTQEVQQDYETGVFESVSGLFSWLVSSHSWLVHQKSLEAVKAFAEVTPYTHIMGDCVPEQLLPSLSDFLNNIPFKREEISLQNKYWIQELIKSQNKTPEEVTTDYKRSMAAQDEGIADNANCLQEPEPKRIKRDVMEDANKDTETDQNDVMYSEVVQKMRSQLKTLTDLRTKHTPSLSIVKEFEEICSTLKTFVQDLKVTQ
ncbi:uncharacterized protein C1orf112-like [Actinia tenebrosa]|uniref:Uncharacterized protein C1orf112-like n=1 Tax=Actinia tenebrosa TaxID=6105 RepID=A0A6P8I512_ACTTE|nr:uncharacterized protein C1orf112-like [Actinia tenebrosa]